MLFDKRLSNSEISEYKTRFKIPNGFLNWICVYAPNRRFVWWHVDCCMCYSSFPVWSEPLVFLQIFIGFHWIQSNSVEIHWNFRMPNTNFPTPRILISQLFRILIVRIRIKISRFMLNPAKFCWFLSNIVEIC